MRLGFDVDGVVADFDSAFDQVCRKLLGKELKEATDAEVPLEELSTADLKRVWKKVVGTRNWWMSLQPYEPAQIERLYALSRQRKWQVFFLTKRPATAGDSVQFQTQWWLEANGFYLPSVLTIPGSRGEAANALHLDLVVDDQLRECADVIGSSTSKAVLMLRATDDQNTHDLATSRGIGVVSSLEEALDVVERVQDLLTSKRGGVFRLSEWFYPTKPAKRDEPVLPMNPRTSRLRSHSAMPNRNPQGLRHRRRVPAAKSLGGAEPFDSARVEPVEARTSLRTCFSLPRTPEGLPGQSESDKLVWSSG